MKKTVTANIGGWVFNIEEDAYEKLSSYLDEIKLYLNGSEGVEEIMRDIESRIAELLKEKNPGVIALENIDAVTSIMGAPKDFSSDDETHQQEFESYKEEKKIHKRYFRLEEDAVLGGVCSGLGAYFGVDPIMFRILFVIMTIAGGSGILIYIVMLLIAPVAKTTTEKLNLRGEPATVENIKQYFSELKDEVKSHKFKKKIKSSVQKSSQAVHGVARVISKIVGFGFMMGAIATVVLLFVFLFGHSGYLPLSGAENTLSAWGLSKLIFTGSTTQVIFWISAFLLIVIPILGMFSIGLRLLFDVKTKMKALSVVFSTLWFLGLFTCATIGAQTGLQFREKGEVSYKVATDENQNDTLKIELKKDIIFSDHIRYHHGIGNDLIKTIENNIVLGYPKLRIKENTADSTFKVTIVQHARGINQSEAIERAENIEYMLTSENGTITLTPHFSLPILDKLRGQEVEIIIKVPHGKTLYLGDNIDRITHGIKTTNGTIDAKLANNYWTMTKDGLDCRNCDFSDDEKTYNSRSIKRGY
jgi:phage shock protein PspC (stress-responsive transcriptional regulator)/gas vesicle protein